MVCQCDATVTLGLPRADAKDQARFGRQASKLVQDSHWYHHVGISSMRMR